jgi:hypothetical protein
MLQVTSLMLRAAAIALAASRESRSAHHDFQHNLGIPIESASLERRNFIPSALIHR